MRVLVRILEWVNGRLTKPEKRHLRAIDSLDPMEQFELAVLDGALESGISLREQREEVGHLAPPHEYAPDDDLMCSICREPMLGHQ